MTEKHRQGGGFSKALMPLVAAAASAAASYLAKKAPQYLDQTVLPRVRETAGSASGVGDVARDLVDRTRNVVGDGGEGAGDTESQYRSNDELERRRRERAEHRASRRRAS